MQEQSFELDKHAQQLIQNQTWNFSRYPYMAMLLYVNKFTVV